MEQVSYIQLGVRLMCFTHQPTPRYVTYTYHPYDTCKLFIFQTNAYDMAHGKKMSKIHTTTYHNHHNTTKGIQFNLWRTKSRVVSYKSIPYSVLSERGGTT